jgi:hypothetical protein
MVESSCSFCRTELKNGDPAYGLTGGVVDGECYGFRMACDEEWDLYCRDCMNKIDRILAEARKRGTGL